jgi:hypothetical protein
MVVTAAASAGHKSNTQASHPQSVSAVSKMICAAAFGVRTALSRRPSFEKARSRFPGRLRAGYAGARTAAKAKLAGGNIGEALLDLAGHEAQADFAARQANTRTAERIVNLANLVIVMRSRIGRWGNHSPRVLSGAST